MADRRSIDITLSDSEVQRIAERVAALLAAQIGAGAVTNAMTVKQAAVFCQCSEAHLDGLRSRGGGPKFVRLGGRRVRYLQDDLVSWMRENARANNASEGLNT